VSITLATNAPDDVLTLSKQDASVVEFLDNTTALPAKLTFKRTDPKPTSSFAGVNRHEVKISQSVQLANSTYAIAIVTISSSLPVGMTTAQRTVFLNRLKDLGANTQVSNLLTLDTLPYGV